MSEVVIKKEKHLEILTEEQFNAFFDTVFDEIDQADSVIYFTDCTDPRNPINIHELTQGKEFVKFDIYQQCIGMTDRPPEDYLEYLILIEDDVGNAYFNQFNIYSKKIKVYWRHQQYIESSHAHHTDEENELHEI